MINRLGQAARKTQDLLSSDLLERIRQIPSANWKAKEEAFRAGKLTAPPRQLDRSRNWVQKYQDGDEQNKRFVELVRTGLGRQINDLMIFGPSPQGPIPIWGPPAIQLYDFFAQGAKRIGEANTSALQRALARMVLVLSPPYSAVNVGEIESFMRRFHRRFAAEIHLMNIRTLAETD